MKRTPPATPPKPTFDGLGPLEDVIKVLTRGGPDARSEAAAAVAATVSLNAAERERVLSLGALEPLLLLLSIPGKARVHALYALTTCAESAETQRRLVARGLIPTLVRILEEEGVRTGETISAEGGQAVPVLVTAPKKEEPNEVPMEMTPIPDTP